MSVWIFLGDDLKKAVPIAFLLLLKRSYSFASDYQDVAVGAEPGHDVAQIQIIRGGRHATESITPLVVRVKQNYVGLDAAIV